MPERATSRPALVITIAALVAASAALGGSAALGWARIEVQTQLLGILPQRLTGSAVQPALGPLAVFALAAVAAVLASSGWTRWLLGALLLGAAALPATAVLRVLDDRWLISAAMSVMSGTDRPARSVPTGGATVLWAGPVVAGVGAVLLLVAGLALVVRGHRMPRLGRRYLAPAARRPAALPSDGRFWERLDAGEDPTAPGHPR